MNISIGEKKVFGGAAPRQVRLKEYCRPGGVTRGVPMSLAPCWGWRTPLDTCTMGEPPTEGAPATLVACPDERGDHVRTSQDAGRCATCGDGCNRRGVGADPWVRRCTRRDAAVRWNGACRGYVAGQPGMHVDGADPCYPRETRPLGERMRISKEDGVRRRDVELRLPHRRTSAKEGVGRKRKEEKDAGKRAAPAGGLQRAGRAW